MNKKPSKDRRARNSLRMAIDRCCIARGQAQWTNGYRAGSRQGDSVTLYDKEQRQWQYVTKVERQLEAYITRYATAVRQQMRTR